MHTLSSLNEAHKRTGTRITTGTPSAQQMKRAVSLSVRQRTLSSRTLSYCAGLVVFFVAWELYTRVAGIRPLTLPQPSNIVTHVLMNLWFYSANGWVTLQEAFWGFWLALFVAVGVATWMVHSDIVERAMVPVIVVVQSIPVVVLLPVFLVWFGFSPWPKILTAALFTWVPFVVNALTGLRSIDMETHELLRSVHASRWEIYWKLRVPHSFPYMFAAGRICVGLALVGAVVGEFFNSHEGLGNAARVAYARLIVEQLWGSVFTLAFMGVVLVLMLGALERRVLHWHASQSYAHRSV